MEIAERGRARKLLFCNFIERRSMLSKTIELRTLQIATDTDHLTDNQRKESGAEPDQETEASHESKEEAESRRSGEILASTSSGESLQSVLTWSRRQVN